MELKVLATDIHFTRLIVTWISEEHTYGVLLMHYGVKVSKQKERVAQLAWDKG
jgi:TusA-related sulfurtransferase